MLDTVIDITPLFLVFGVGYLLKHFGLLQARDGGLILKLIFYIGAPALIFVSITKVELETSLAWLSLLPACVVSITLLTCFLLRQSMLRKVNRKTFISLMTGAVIMNTGFLIPFIYTIYGTEGLARFAIIDAFNGIITFTLIYALVVKLANDRPDINLVVKKLLISPPVWALAVALILKAVNATPPAAAISVASFIGEMVGPLILIALGLLFTLKISQPRLLVFPLALRFLLGGMVGLAFVKLTGLEGINAEVALFASLAPIGFNSITFSELEKLDVEFAASQVSFSLLIGFIATPFLAYWLPGIV